MAGLVELGIVLILAGFAVVVVAVMLSGRMAEGEVKGGGVVMIGPIPIIFGSDAKWTSIAIALAVVLVALSLLLYLV